MKAEQPGVKPMIFELQVICPKHYTTGLHFFEWTAV